MCKEQQNTVTTCTTSSLITIMKNQQALPVPMVCLPYFENLCVTPNFPNCYFSNQLKILHENYFFYICNYLFNPNSWPFHGMVLHPKLRYIIAHLMDLHTAPYSILSSILSVAFLFHRWCWITGLHCRDGHQLWNTMLQTETQLPKLHFFTVYIMVCMCQLTKFTNKWTMFFNPCN